LAPDEAREIANLLEEMRAELGDAARSTLTELTALLNQWDEVVGLLPGNGAASQQTTSRVPQRPLTPAAAPAGDLDTMSRADVARMLKASVSTIQ
jgi:hypothetical protein